MKRVLLLLLLATGCRTWEVNAFGVPVNGQPRYMTASSELTTDEKIGVIIIVGIAIGGAVALALAAD